MKKSFHTISPGDEIHLYNDLIETTKSLREIIEDAAARGYALEYWIEGA